MDISTTFRDIFLLVQAICFSPNGIGFVNRDLLLSKLCVYRVVKLDTPPEECFGRGEVGWYIGKDSLVSVFAVASLRDEVLPDVEPLRIATAIGVKLGPCESALSVRPLLLLGL
jgi:hypothetical protein